MKLAISLLLLSTAALAQHDHHEMAVGYIPIDVLQRPVEIRKGVGTVNEKVTTNSAQAQTFYNQGVAYLHSYVWLEAARSFHQALRLDPNIAMAYVDSRASDGTRRRTGRARRDHRAKTLAAAVMPASGRQSASPSAPCKSIAWPISATS